MKTFDEILEDTALEHIEAFDYELVTYVKSRSIGTGSIMERATLGMMTGRAVSLATLGIVKDTEEAVLREIKAIIDRVRPAEAGPHGQGPVLIVTVCNDADDGIYYTEIDTGRDLIELPVRIGEDPQLRRIAGVINSDSGMMKLRVR